MGWVLSTHAIHFCSPACRQTGGCKHSPYGFGKSLHPGSVDSPELRRFFWTTSRAGRYKHLYRDPLEDAERNFQSPFTLSSECLP